VWWLVANWVPNLVDKVLKLSTESGESWVNHLSAPSLREVGKTLHHIALSVL